jgi:hypothetical protein
MGKYLKKHNTNNYRSSGKQKSNKWSSGLKIYIFWGILFIDNQIVPSISQCADWCTD